jgi:hypothetical protein
MNDKSAGMLKFLARPMTFESPEVGLQREIGAEIHELIQQGAAPLMFDVGRRIPHDAFCLGGILLPDNLDQSNHDILESSKFIKIKPANNIPDGYDVISGNYALQRKIVQLMVNTVIRAGQLDYLREVSLSLRGWAILIEVHYYYKRSKSQINFHKDTLGQTLFVNLIYMNDQEINGPEYILNPPSTPAHDAKTFRSLPFPFLQDLAKIRAELPAPTHIENSFIPRYGVVSFVDEAIHHTTPLYGHRVIRPSDIKEFLKAIWPVGSPHTYDSIKALCDSPATASQVPAKLQTWIGMSEADGRTRYSRVDLAAAQFPQNYIDELIDRANDYGFTTFASPIAADPTGHKNRFRILPPHAPRLVRRNSDPEVIRRMPVDTPAPRSFFRTWVRAVPANQIG